MWFGENCEFESALYIIIFHFHITCTNFYTCFHNVIYAWFQVSLVAKLEIRDDSGKDMVCFLWPAQIVD